MSGVNGALKARDIMDQVQVTFPNFTAREGIGAAQVWALIALAEALEKKK